MSNCPRTGQPCSVPKQFNVTEVTPNGVRSLQCCQNCVLNQADMTAVPVQNGILPILPNPIQGLQQLMQKITGQHQQQAPGLMRPPVLPTCPACGCNPVDIEQAGRFGCPGCYKAFKEDIETMLMRHHAAIKHVGKVPKAWLARQEAGEKETKDTTVDRAVATVKRHKMVPLEERIKVLEDKMASCVKIEDYERAAIIRDVIKQMKNVSPSASSSSASSPPEASSETPSAS